MYRAALCLTTWYLFLLFLNSFWQEVKNKANCMFYFCRQKEKFALILLPAQPQPSEESAQIQPLQLARGR